MTNLSFLQDIDAVIYKYEDNYYVRIPFASYDESSSYMTNFNNCIYIKLSQEFLENDDIEYFISTKDYTYEFLDNTISLDKMSSHDYEYYTIINGVIKDNFTEEQILNTYQTFAKILQDYMYVEDVSLKTQIYKMVINYYANGKVDNVLTGLKLLLESPTYKYTSNGTTVNCGCNAALNGSTGLSTNGTSPTDSAAALSCPDVYLNALDLYLKQMFGDLDFYCNFFGTDTENNEPNTEMIDMLICLLEKMLELLGNGKNLYSSDSQKHHCLCAENETEISSAYNIILNYIKVLNWVKNCEIEENSNKIQVYGTQFGEVFTNLYFI